MAAEEAPPEEAPKGPAHHELQSGAPDTVLAGVPAANGPDQLTAGVPEPLKALMHTAQQGCAHQDDTGVAGACVRALTCMAVEHNYEHAASVDAAAADVPMPNTRPCGPIEDSDAGGPQVDELSRTLDAGGVAGSTVVGPQAKGMPDSAPTESESVEPVTEDAGDVSLVPSPPVLDKESTASHAAVPRELDNIIARGQPRVRWGEMQNSTPRSGHSTGARSSISVGVAPPAPFSIKPRQPGVAAKFVPSPRRTKVSVGSPAPQLTCEVV